MSEEVAELIRALDTPTGDDAEEARASLRSMGAVAVAALLKALPELGFFGKLTAIEVCEESGDQTSGSQPLSRRLNWRMRSQSAMPFLRIGLNQRRCATHLRRSVHANRLCPR